jgi:hypothetical protein
VVGLQVLFEIICILFKKSVKCSAQGFDPMTDQVKMQPKKEIWLPLYFDRQSDSQISFAGGIAMQYALTPHWERPHLNRKL